MKTKLFALSLGLFLLPITMMQASDQPTSGTVLQNEIQAQFSKVFPANKFSIDGFVPNKETKSFSGSGTFFGKKKIGFKGGYTTENEIANIEITFPDKSKIKIKSKDLLRFSGYSLAPLVPSELAKSVFLKSLEMKFSKPDKALEQLVLGFKSKISWRPLSKQSLSIDDVNFAFVVMQPMDKSKRALKGIVTGKMNIGSKPFEIAGEIFEDKRDFKLMANIPQLKLKETINSVGGSFSLKGFSIPNAVIDLNLTDAIISVWPNRDQATIDAASNWGEVSAWLNKSGKKSKKLEYVVTISPPDNFKLSQINPGLGVLDMVDLSGQTIVISSAKKEKSEVSKIPSLAQMKTALNEGCHLVSKMDLTKLKLDHFLGAKELFVSSPLSAKLDQVKLESNIEKNIKLGDNAELTNILFRLSPSPKSFAVSLLGSMKTRLGQDDLVFKGGMELIMSTQTMNFLAMMEGEWHNPLGVQGLVMADMGMQLGGSFGGATILPNVAFDGTLKIGRFNGRAAIALDTRRPDKSMISANLEKLYFSDILSSVVDRRTKNKLPKDLVKAMQSIRMNKLYLEAVPTDMEVLGKSYKAGFRTGGNIDFFGINGYADIDINYRTGFFGQGAVDPIDLGAFKLKGVNGKSKPSLLIELRPAKTSRVAINGSVSLLGITAQTDIETRSNGLKFMVGGKIFNLFNGRVDVSATNLQRLEAMYVKVQMEQDLFNFVRNDARKFVENNIGGAIQKLTQAQQKITDAQTKVNGINRDIANMRKKVEKDQAGDRAKLAKAEKDVSNAQSKVNGLQGEINKLEKSKKGKNLIEVGYIETKIKGVQIAKGTANGVLEGYKQTLKFVRTKVIVNPDLDHRMIALNGSKGLALGALEGAKGGLEAVKFTLGFTGNVASFVMKNGPDALINIRSASFEGGLGTVSGAKVNLQLDLEWMKKRQNVTVGFDFNNPQKMIEDLGRKLMKI